MIPLVKTTVGRTSLSFTEPSMFNKLPKDMCEAMSAFRFNRLLKVHLGQSVERFSL